MADTVVWVPATFTSTYPVGVRPRNDRGDFVQGHADVTLGSSATYLRGHYSVVWQNRDEEVANRYHRMVCVEGEGPAAANCPLSINKNSVSSGTEIVCAYALPVVDVTRAGPGELTSTIRTGLSAGGLANRFGFTVWYDRFTDANPPPYGPNAAYTKQFFSGWSEYQYWYPDWARITASPGSQDVFGVLE